MRGKKAKAIRNIVYGNYSSKGDRVYVYLKKTMRKLEIIDKDKLKNIPLLERVKAKFLGNIDKILPKTQVVTGTLMLDQKDRTSQMCIRYKKAKLLVKKGVAV